MATRALIGKIQGDKVRYIYNQSHRLWDLGRL